MLTVPSSNARLRGTTNKQSGGKSPVTPTSDDGRLNSPGGLSQRSKSSSNLSNKLPPLPATPGLSQSISMDSTGDEVLNSYRLPQPLPLWLNPAYAKHIVKGNFMTLSSRPKTVDQGEWMAHQGITVYLIFAYFIADPSIAVEHYRNLWNFVHVVYTKELNGNSICNAKTCPRMSAGP
jgi:hypothetical protein